jgi:hypothetical protein
VVDSFFASAAMSHLKGTAWFESRAQHLFIASTPRTQSCSVGILGGARGNDILKMPANAN